VIVLPEGTAFRTAEDALQPYTADDGPFGAAEAAHLLRRAGFGAPVAERARVAALGAQAAVAELLAPRPPEGDYAALLAALAPLEDADDLVVAQSLWLTLMLRDPSPFREALALCWHGHFATSAAKVGRVPLMVGQIAMLRERGPGPLPKLLAAVARDPAMIAWLDGNANRAHHPN